MVKTVIVTLSVDIPDSELSQDATVTIGSNNYAGKVTGIVTHEASPAMTSVTLKGTGLSVA